SGYAERDSRRFRFPPARRGTDRRSSGVRDRRYTASRLSPPECAGAPFPSQDERNSLDRQSRSQLGPRERRGYRQRFGGPVSSTAVQRGPAGGRSDARERGGLAAEAGVAGGVGARGARQEAERPAGDDFQEFPQVSVGFECGFRNGSAAMTRAIRPVARQHVVRFNSLNLYK